MPFKGLSRFRLKEHFRKTFWLYILGAVVCMLLTSLIYTATRYQSPPDKSVLIYLVDDYTDTEALDELAAETLAAMQELDPTLETVVFEPIAYTDPETDYTSPMLLMTRMALGEGDVYLCSSKAIHSLASSGLCLPLDDYLDSGWLAEYDLEPFYFENVDTGETELMALSLDKVEGFRKSGAFDNRGAYLVMTGNSTNAETSKAAIEYIIDALMEETDAPAESTEPAA